MLIPILQMLFCIKMPSISFPNLVFTFCLKDSELNLLKKHLGT